MHDRVFKKRHQFANNKQGFNIAREREQIKRFNNFKLKHLISLWFTDANAEYVCHYTPVQKWATAIPLHAAWNSVLIRILIFNDKKII